MLLHSSVQALIARLYCTLKNMRHLILQSYSLPNNAAKFEVGTGVCFFYPGFFEFHVCSDDLKRKKNFMSGTAQTLPILHRQIMTKHFMTEG